MFLIFTTVVSEDPIFQTNLAREWGWQGVAGENRREWLKYT